MVVPTGADSTLFVMEMGNWGEAAPAVGASESAPIVAVLSTMASARATCAR